MEMWQDWGGIPISQSLDTPRIQVEDSGHWIPQNPVGKMRESHRILYPAGRHWKLSGFFSSGFLRNFCAFHQEPAGNHRKQSGKFPAEMLLPYSRDFRYFPAGTGSCFLPRVSYVSFFILDILKVQHFSALSSFKSFTLYHRIHKYFLT